MTFWGVKPPSPLKAGTAGLETTQNEGELAGSGGRHRIQRAMPVAPAGTS